MALDKTKNQLIERAGFNQYFKAKQWSEYNRLFFNNLAPKYDYLNQVITLGMQSQYKTQVIKRTPILNGDLVLDICTGSGDMAMFIAQRYPSCHVVGVDFAEKMLEIARERTQHLTNVEFSAADAMQLPFPDKSFDASMMSYGLRNLDDIKQGVQEMVRVTKPGGSITILDLGKPEGRVERMVYKLYFEKLMPFLGKYIFHRDEFNSFQYLSESNKFFPPASELVKTMGHCGIKEIKTYRYMMGIVCQLVGICDS